MPMRARCLCLGLAAFYGIAAGDPVPMNWLPLCVVLAAVLGGTLMPAGSVGAGTDPKEAQRDGLKAERVLFLGNSITLHGPAPQIGWSGNWGMAAGAQDKDYVHLLLARIAAATGKPPEAMIENIAEFERDSATFDVGAALKKPLEFGANLVIVAIGENVPALTSEDAKTTFRNSLSSLLAALRKQGEPAIFVRSCFWPDKAKDGILRDACREANGTFVDISSLALDESHFARSERQFAHAGVAAHPGDKGMKASAEALWKAIQERAALKTGAALPLDKELLAKIEALPDNTWLKLPPIKTAGETSWLDSDYRRDGPRVRDYCNRMVWAPERKRALYCGAGHNIHPFNDVWEYDLAANTWICLYAPDPAYRGRFSSEEEGVVWHRANIVYNDGVIRTPRGGPVRPAHTWWGLCYDPALRRLVFWDAHKGLIFTNRKLMANALGIEETDPVLKGSGSGAGEAWVFTFYPEERQWREVLTKAPKAYESSQLEYIPHLKALWLNSGATYLLPEGKTTGWTMLAKSGVPGGALTAYDPESKAVVAVGGGATYSFSFATNAWSKVHDDSPGAVVPHSVFCYDTAAKRFILYTHVPAKGETARWPQLWVYDPRGNRWTEPAPKGEMPAGGGAGYYDPQRNVTVIYGNRASWVYRCQRVTKQAQ